MKSFKVLLPKSLSHKLNPKIFTADSLPRPGDFFAVENGNPYEVEKLCYIPNQDGTCSVEVWLKD
jgi:hypothetical protein